MVMMRNRYSAALTSPQPKSSAITQIMFGFVAPLDSAADTESVRSEANISCVSKINSDYFYNSH